MFSPAEFLLTPRDIFRVIRQMRARDWRILLWSLGAGAGVALWLADAGAGLFAAGLVATLYWRIDSRWPLGAALVCLILIPAMQLAYDNNLLFSGQAISQALAVAVWYLLAIGVIRQVVELRRRTPVKEAVVLPSVPAPATVIPSPEPPPVVPAQPATRRPLRVMEGIQAPSLRRQRMAERQGTEPPARQAAGVRPPRQRQPITPPTERHRTMDGIRRGQR